MQSYSGDANSAASPGSPAPLDDSSQAYRQARDHADEADSAASAVAGWQQFVDKYPDSQDIATARQELDRWKKLASEDAEKINGVWVGGDDRRKIIDQAEELTRQAVDMLDNKQTLQAVDKLKQAVKIYPNSFLTNFSLGYVSLIEGDYDEGAQYFATTIRLRPESAEAVNNLGVANIQRADGSRSPSTSSCQPPRSGQQRRRGKSGDRAGHRAVGSAHIAEDEIDVGSGQPAGLPIQHHRSSGGRIYDSPAPDGRRARRDLETRRTRGLKPMCPDGAEPDSSSPATA